MKFDVAEWAGKLEVVNVFAQGNKSGVVTEQIRYDSSLGVAPRPEPLVYWIRHVTVGTDSLAWLARTSPQKICIPYLIPRAGARVFKMIPDGTRCHHIGDAEWHGKNEGWLAPRCSGFEIENLGTWAQEITDEQYIKAGLIYAYDSALYSLQDYNVLDHSNIAVPHGRRSDPQAGLFRESLFWGVVKRVRDEWPWPIAAWNGGRA